MLHAIHTTADFEMEKLLYTDKGAVEKLYQKIADGRLKTIVTDVTMAASGIRKGALQRLGVEVKCYLSDERVAAMAAGKKGSPVHKPVYVWRWRNIRMPCLYSVMRRRL